MQSGVQSWRPCATAFCDFSSPRLWSIAPATKNCSSSQNWRFDAPKCNPSQEITALNCYNFWWTCLLYCACDAKCMFADPLQTSHACHPQKLYILLTFLARCRILCACHAKPHLNLQKWSGHVVLLTLWLGNLLRAHNSVRSWCVLHILTWKRALRQMGVQFFDISTSTSGPPLVCFVRSKCASCHDGFQKWSNVGVFCTFWLRNVLRATTVCNFSSLIGPDGSTPAAQIIGKNTVNRDFLTYSCTGIMHLLSSHSFSSLIFSLLLFFSLTLHTSAFSSVHIFVGSLTSKLPSTRPHRHFE